jgi:hypothetical protein
MFPQASSSLSTLVSPTSTSGNSRQIYQGMYVVGAAIPEAYGLSSNGTRGSYMPNNFYIGPNDQVRVYGSTRAIQGKSAVPQTISIRYSFTLITES